MAQLIKQWTTGTGNLSVTYDGDGDGTAVFASDTNEGIDRVMDVSFKAGDVVVERNVMQQGLRQQFRFNDGRVLRMSNGGRFAVLKAGGPIVPPIPLETYTRLTYVESTGEQYIDLGYTVKVTDIIKMRYIPTAVESGRMFGTNDDTGHGIYYSLSNKDSYARFGSVKSTIIDNGIEANYVSLKKGVVSINTWEAEVSYEGMPTTSLYLFAHNSGNNGASNNSKFRLVSFSIEDTDGIIMDLLPYRRDSDGVVGLLDSVTGSFYTVVGDTPLLAGAEIQLSEGYALLDGVTFNAEKIFDIGVISHNDSIEIMYQRADAANSQYLYGIVNSGNTASVTAYLASNGAWRFGSQLVRPNTANGNVHRTVISNGAALHDCSALVMNPSVNFTTANTVILGGYRDASGVISKTYKGKIYYIIVQSNTPCYWIACQRLSDGVEGFWDCVSQTFIEPMS